MSNSIFWYGIGVEQSLQKYWSGRRVLITGATGQDGAWLAELLIQLGAEVHGLIRRSSSGVNLRNIRKVMGKLNLHYGDMLDQASVSQAIRKSDCEHVFHLAAQTFVAKSFDSPSDTYYVNVIGTTNVLEAARIHDSKLSGFLFASSSEIYGMQKPEEMPTNEDAELRPASPYAISKSMGDSMSRLYHKAYGLPIVVTRAYNHESPYRGKVFATMEIARQVARVIQGQADRIVLGNLEAKRDFTDARDIVYGYLLALAREKPGEVYNFGSGVALSILEVAKMTLVTVGAKLVPIVSDPRRLRPSDVPVMLCDAGKAWSELGWRPVIPLKETMKEMVDYWLQNRNGD